MITQRWAFHGFVFFFNLSALAFINFWTGFHATLGTGPSLISVLILDLWAYWAHRLFHTRVLWRLHRVHHSDPILDSSVALRFHFLQSFLGGLGELAILSALRPPLEIYLLFIALTWASLLFHHSQMELPLVENHLGNWIVTPHFHRAHHLQGASGNYSVIFSFWDRLFGTALSPVRSGNYGIEGVLNPYSWKSIV